MKHFKISDTSVVESIKNSLAALEAFDKRAAYLCACHSADGILTFTSLDNGKRFSALYFDNVSEIDINLFKVAKGVGGRFKARPRKSNKKFYKDFMTGLDDVDLKPFANLLFGTFWGIDVVYKWVDDVFYVATDSNLIIPAVEITKDEYYSASEKELTKLLKKIKDSDFSFYRVEKKEIIWRVDESSFDVSGWYDSDECALYETALELYESFTPENKHKLNGASLQEYSDLFIELNKDQQESVMSYFIESYDCYELLHGRESWVLVNEYYFDINEARRAVEGRSDLRLVCCPAGGQLFTLLQAIKKGEIGEI